MYCLCVTVYCTTATGCQTNCSWQIYHIIKSSQITSGIEPFKETKVCVTIAVCNIRSQNCVTGSSKHLIRPVLRIFCIEFKCRSYSNHVLIYLPWFLLSSHFASNKHSLSLLFLVQLKFKAEVVAHTHLPRHQCDPVSLDSLSSTSAYKHTDQAAVATVYLCIKS
jgi:hypothetical protein